MFDAQLLMNGSTVYSPWMSRGGDGVLVTLEVVAVSGATIKVELWTKNSEDTGDGSNSDTTGGTPQNITVMAVGRTTQEWSKKEAATIGLDELVRYKFTVTGSSGTWVLFRMLAPSWFDAVDAS